MCEWICLCLGLKEGGLHNTLLTNQLQVWISKLTEVYCFKYSDVLLTDSDHHFVSCFSYEALVSFLSLSLPSLSISLSLCMCASMRVCVWVLVYLCVCACVGEYSACKITTNCHLILSRNFETDLNEAQKVKLMIYDKKTFFVSLHLESKEERENPASVKGFYLFWQNGKKDDLKLCIKHPYVLMHLASKPTKRRKRGWGAITISFIEKTLFRSFGRRPSMWSRSCKDIWKSQTNPSFGPKSLRYFWGSFWCFYFFIVKTFYLRLCSRIKIGGVRFEPGNPGGEAQMIPLCYATPQKCGSQKNPVNTMEDTQVAL